MTAVGDQTATAALQIRRLTVSHSGKPALWDVTAEFPAGALSAIVGPNGAGKSTLLRAALGLLPADSGQVMLEGRPARSALHRLAYVPQHDAVDSDFPITVREVVEMGRYRDLGWFRRPRRTDRAVIADSLDRVGMAGFGSRRIGELSGGQRQRMFIARALAQQAPVLLMDEPFAGVDTRTEAVLLELLRELRAAGRSVILVHHDLGTVRSEFDWALLLNVRAVACGPVCDVVLPEQLRRAYGGEVTVYDGDGVGAEATWLT